MQISERFRRGVVVPLDNVAVHALRANDVADTTRVHFVGICDQAEFESLWKAGVFQAINEATGSMLDDYEEAEVAVEMVPRVRRVVESCARSGVGGSASARFFAALIDACGVAEHERMPMYFVL